DDPYEEPSAPDVVVETEEQSPEESARTVVGKLEELGLVVAGLRA
ncbi:MAG: adenylyl-sulfate kinase, partial [Thermoleophilia bacterium]|nr:adenylyl-sulfate kinase [Thermoleophilia bacterium]